MNQFFTSALFQSADSDTKTQPADRKPVQPFEKPGEPQAATEIDKLVSANLKRHGLRPSYICSDAVFIRRVFFDVIGTQPTPQEARLFIQDKTSKKRQTVIDQLLERDELADYWALKWGDLLRIKAEFPINLWPNAVQAYYRWVHTAIRNNMPYDQFVREMLTSSGSNFRVGPVNFYRAVQDRDPKTVARTVALTFMGVSAEDWPEDRLNGFAAFFSRIGFKQTSEWKEEIIFFDPEKKMADGSDPPLQAIFPDGTPYKLAPEEDPRIIFSRWLIRAENPWFARNIVNRIWYWLLGRGIVHEPDDIRPGNPPSNPELLNYLADELIKSNYDLRHIFRLILNSQTYQMSSIPRSAKEAAPINSTDSKANDKKESKDVATVGEVYFANYSIRRLDAEVLIDALCQLTDSNEEYSSPIPEPFTFIPEDQRSIALADGSITSSFLEMFGRPPRDTGRISERNNRPTAAQSLHLLNSSHIRNKLEQSTSLKQRLNYGKTPAEKVSIIYLTVLSRLPTQQEIDTFNQYAKSGVASSSQAGLDLVWALVNSPEFMFRH